MKKSSDDSVFGAASCPKEKPEPCAAEELVDDVDPAGIPHVALLALAEVLGFELEGIPKPGLAAEPDGENVPERFEPLSWSAAVELDSGPPSPEEPRFSSRSLGYGASCPDIGWADDSDTADEVAFLEVAPAPPDGASRSDVGAARAGSPAVEPAPPVGGTVTSYRLPPDGGD
jgi:hypothetical protein